MCKRKYNKCEIENTCYYVILPNNTKSSWIHCMEKNLVMYIYDFLDIIDLLNIRRVAHAECKTIDVYDLQKPSRRKKPDCVINLNYNVQRIAPTLQLHHPLLSVIDCNTSNVLYPNQMSKTLKREVWKIEISHITELYRFDSSHMRDFQNLKVFSMCFPRILTKQNENLNIKYKYTPISWLVENLSSINASSVYYVNPPINILINHIYPPKMKHLSLELNIPVYGTLPNDSSFSSFPLSLKVLEINYYTRHASPFMVKFAEKLSNECLAKCLFLDVINFLQYSDEENTLIHWAKLRCKVISRLKLPAITWNLLTSEKYHPGKEIIECCLNTTRDFTTCYNNSLKEIYMVARDYEPTCEKIVSKQEKWFNFLLKVAESNCMPNLKRIFLVFTVGYKDDIICKLSVPDKREIYSNKGVHIVVMWRKQLDQYPEKCYCDLFTINQFIKHTINF